MNPSDEAPLSREIKRLREQLEYLDERHLLAMENLRTRITEIEGKLINSPKLPEKFSERAPLPRAETFVLIPPTLPVKAVEAQIPSPAVAPSPQPIPRSSAHGELDFGKVWFVRIGIVILLTGLVFLGNYAYQNWVREMPNGFRLTALSACAIILIETGRRLAAKENLNRFGEVLLAGGMAFFYYCAFTAHHVGRLQVIESPVAGALLIFAAAGGIAAVSWLRKTQATAILGILLASYSTMLQPIGWMSCISSILLGAMGLVFMFRPGWAGPGWASMLGSYGAFFGWQMLGASGETLRIDDPAVLWFLPPLWVMFAIPGVLGRFRESLTDRNRAWFTAANNAFFFLLFSAIWLQRHGEGYHWQFAAVFGTVLIALGILGRRQNATAGGVNISQGIAVATLALILRLEGQNLALVLAFESLALAIAAWKFRGKSETVFSLLAGLGSTGLILYHSSNESLSGNYGQFPVWSIALTALLLLASSRMAMRTESLHEILSRFLRTCAAILFVCAAAIATYLCSDRLDHTPALLTAITLALILSIAFIRFDKEREQPELLVGVLWFLILSVVLGSGADGAWPLIITTLISLASCWLWHQTEQVPCDPEAKNFLRTRSPEIPAWAFSFATPVFAAMVVAAEGGSFLGLLIFDELTALLLAAIAIGLRCKRLLSTASAMALLSLGLAFRADFSTNHLLFLVALIALMPAALIRLPWSRERIAENHRTYSSWRFRSTAFIAYCAAWYQYAPENWSDWLALTSIALTLLTFFLKRKLFAESVGLIGVGLVAFAIATTSSPWQLAPDESGWRGITVVIALLSLVFTYRQRPALIADPALRMLAIAILAGLACLITTLWATQMLVWRLGWKPTAVLWTVLGFAFVSAGLWQRLHILRVSGFALLVLSLGKLFTHDVWDFTTFMRVVSFIVLGAALIVLGLFYNKFAEAIKALLDDEEAVHANRIEPDPEETE